MNYKSAKDEESSSLNASLCDYRKCRVCWKMLGMPRVHRSKVSHLTPANLVWIRAESWPSIQIKLQRTSQSDHHSLYWYGVKWRYTLQQLCIIKLSPLLGASGYYMQIKWNHSEHPSSCSSNTCSPELLFEVVAWSMLKLCKNGIWMVYKLTCIRHYGEHLYIKLCSMNIRGEPRNAAFQQLFCDTLYVSDGMPSPYCDILVHSIPMKFLPIFKVVSLRALTVCKDSCSFIFYGRCTH